MLNIFLVLAIFFLAICSVLYFAPRLKLLNFVHVGSAAEVVVLNRYAAVRLLLPFFVNLFCSHAASERPGLTVPLIFLTPVSVLVAVIWISAGAKRHRHTG